MLLRPLYVALFVLLPASSNAEPDAPVDLDPRVVEANALLGDKGEWPRALDLYRATLADDPDDVVARHWLARVLSWDRRFDESIAEYDVLIARPDTPDSLPVEKAEVLSWAGRYDEAEAALFARLQTHPDDARATRALARVYRWSGRLAEADRAYVAALELEDDAEAREEWTALRSEFPEKLALRVGHFADNLDFRRNTAQAEVSFYPSLETRVLARTAFIDVDDEFAGELGFEGSDQAGELVLGIERRIGERWRGQLEAGARVWSEAGAGPLASARLEYTTSWDGVVAVQVDHADLLDLTDSLAAVEDDLNATTATASLWKSISPRWQSFTRLHVSRYSDSNSRVASSTELSYKPWSGPDLWLRLGLDYLRFSDDATLYYDPEIDVQGMFRASYRATLPFAVRFEGQAGAGYGHAKQDGVTGNGPAFEVLASATKSFFGWRVSLLGSFAQSRRAEVYRSHRANVMLARDF